jgi:hypothetical protein
MTISRWILLRIKDLLDKSCRENQNTHFMFNSFSPQNHTVYEIMSKNVAKTEGPQMTSQYGTYELHAGKARLHACTCMHTPTRPGTPTHTQTNMQCLLLFHGNNDLRTRLSVTLYVHCVSCSPWWRPTFIETCSKSIKNIYNWYVYNYGVYLCN